MSTSVSERVLNESIKLSRVWSMLSPEQKANYYRTVEQNPWIPTNEILPLKVSARQMELVTAPEGEILYGGAAGGGKTAGELIAALQYVEQPNYKALILRRKLTQLDMADSILDLCKQWCLPRANYNGATRTFTFPSGARIQFGHCKDEESKRNYDGPAYQFIGFDEACHFSETQFAYISMGRQRDRVDSAIPQRVCLSAMPGGPGHDWVKRRFIIPARENTMPAGRRYIPAKLADNPFINQDAYRKKLAEMHNVDPVTADRMADGDWDAIAGSRFKKEWFRYWYRVKGAGGWWADCRGERISIDQCVRFLTIDTASTAREHDDTGKPDYTACSAWALAGRYLLLLGVYHEKIEAPEWPPVVADMYVRYKCGIAYVEETGQNKPSQWLKKHVLPMGGYMNVRGFSKGNQDKLAYNLPLINLVHAGRVWFPGDDPMLSEIEGEHLLFTGTKLDAHEDIVDTGGTAARQMDSVNRSASAAASKDYGYEPVGPRHGGMG